MTLGLLASSFVFADEAPQQEIAPVEASYGYVSLGLGPFPIPAPLLGIGGRYQKGHNGVDGSLQFFTVGSGFTIVKENIDYLYYFKPNLASQFYVGGGIGLTETISHRKFNAFVSPQFVLGKQYTNDAGDVRYFQAQIDPVFVRLDHFNSKHHRHVTTFPAIVLSYGICF